MIKAAFKDSRVTKNILNVSIIEIIREPYRENIKSDSFSYHSREETKKTRVSK